MGHFYTQNFNTQKHSRPCDLCELMQSLAVARSAPCTTLAYILSVHDVAAVFTDVLFIFMGHFYAGYLVQDIFVPTMY